MNQKLSDWASVAEIFSGIAVVITLIFLIIGINENTEITRAATYASHLEAFNTHGSDIFKDPELTRIYEAWLTEDLTTLDETDMQRLEQIIFNEFRVFEMAFFAQQYGLYGADERERMDRLTCVNYRRVVGTEIEFIVTDLMTRRFSQHMAESC